MAAAAMAARAMGDHARPRARRRCSCSRRSPSSGRSPTRVAIPLVSAVVTPLALLAAAVLPWDALLELAAWLTAVAAAVPRMVRVSCRRRSGSSTRRRSGRAARAGGRRLAARAARPALARDRPRADAARRRAAAARARAGRSLDHDARRGAGPRGAGAHREPRAALRRRARRSAPRPTAASASSRPTCAPTGIERLDAMVVTHNDNDHAGGAASVLENFEVDALLYSLAGGPPAARRCVAGAQRCAARHGLGMGRRALRDPASGAARGAARGRATT